MITRQLVSHSFKSEKTQTPSTVKESYQAPKAVTVGTSQQLLQGSWCSGNIYDGNGYYYRTGY
jgi:hypothetical protein